MIHPSVEITRSPGLTNRGRRITHYKARNEGADTLVSCSGFPVWPVKPCLSISGFSFGRVTTDTFCGEGAMPISSNELKELVSYDPDTGVFNWISPTCRCVRIGQKAGAINGSGYVVISIRCRNYRAHRLAWLYVNGEWPTSIIDHINGNRSDNRISNLRVVSTFQNSWNKRVQKNNKSGYKGVSYSTREKKWAAQISAHNKIKHLGFFSTPEAAYQKYCEASRTLHGEFSYVNKDAHEGKALGGSCVTQ